MPLFQIMFYLLLFLLYWIVGFLGVRWWHKQSGHWYGNPIASRTAFVAGALAGPLTWPLGFFAHGIDNPKQPINPMQNDSYSVYHYDTETRQTTDVILEGVDITTADKKARYHAKREAAAKNSIWKRSPAGENCKFYIEGERMGFIVIKENAGSSYERVLQSQQKAVAQ
jgi:hypothetical protein